ncbi:hypothetical protein [Thermococcus camini]|nr:hypothetical protein [Thermococcus camini]
MGMSGVAVGIGILFLGLIMAFFIHADPDRFVEAYTRDNRNKDVSDIEIIRAAYSECIPYVNEGLNTALISWLLLGIWTAFIEFGIATGTVVIKNWSLFWLLIFVSSIGSLLGFILTVIFFLRKKSIRKALFAIQLKKSDKAEISIKI